MSASRDIDIQKIAKVLGVKPSAITITYKGNRKKVLKKIKADVAAAEKAGYAVESLDISDDDSL